MSSMSDYAYGLALRDTIQRMVREELNSQRPRYRYGTVVGINHSTMKCEVRMNGETGTVLVNMGSVQPSEVGQVVRVDGIGTDKFLTDVVGSSAAYGARRGTIEQYYTAGNPRVLWDGDTTYSGPYPVEGGYHPEAGDTVIGTPMPGYGFILQPAFTINLRYRPRFIRVADSVGFLNGWENFQTTATVGMNAYPDYPFQLPEYGTPGFTKTIAGIVKLKGLAKKPSGVAPAGGEILFYLPPGFRPHKQVMCPGTANDASCRFDVYPNGSVRVWGGSATWVSLDNITFVSADTILESVWTEVTYAGGSGFSHYDVSAGSQWPAVGYWKDVEGIVHTRGLYKRATPPTANTVVYTLPSGYEVAQDVWMRSVTSSSAYMGFTGASASGNRSHPANLNTTYVSQDGHPVVPVGTVLPGGWRTLDLQGAWTSYGGTFAAPRYAITPGGHVHMQGLAKAAAAQTVPTLIGILAPGFRPKQKLLMAGVANSAHYRLNINPDGGVYGYAGQSNLWSSFDSINFIAEQ